MAETALLFPGQGSQQVGMGSALFDASEAARGVLGEVEDALGEGLGADALGARLGALMRDGPDDELRLTRNTQPALMTTSLAVVREIEARLGGAVTGIARAVAGHSLGEYSALAVAGVLDVPTAARLLRLRGEAMQNAVPVGEGAMAALLGVDIEAVRGIMNDGAAVDIANDNAPGQVVISGAADAVEAMLPRAKEAGARKAMTLPVSAPFHCRLMQPAAIVMEEALAATEFGTPSVPVWSNVTVLPEIEPAKLRDNLVAQVTGMVRWRETLVRMSEVGITRFVEIGTGKVLTGLVKRTLPEAEAISVESPEDIDALLEKIA